MRQWASYPKPFKVQAVQECLQPDTTVSEVAIKHGINANVIRKWPPLFRDGPPPELPAFIPLKIEPKRQPEASVIIEQPVADLYIPSPKSAHLYPEDRFASHTRGRSRMTVRAIPAHYARMECC
jgi:transposase